MKKYLPDFPKVAITYSISENEEASLENQNKMKESMQDYNEEYQTNFTMETIRAYNRNVNERLARKKREILSETRTTRPCYCRGPITYLVLMHHLCQHSL